MNIEERHKIFRQIMWDYNISPEEVEAVLKGEKEFAGHFNRQNLMVRMLESIPWFTLIEVVPPQNLKQWITTDVIKKLRSKSLQKKYKYARKRLQEIIQDPR